MKNVARDYVTIVSKNGAQQMCARTPQVYLLQGQNEGEGEEETEEEGVEPKVPPILEAI